MATILAVDDDQIFQVLVKRIFEPMGFQVVSALTSDEGLELARQVEPALILVDVRLPGKIGDGWALATLLKHTAQLESTPVIMVSASGGGMGARPPEAAEYDGYYSKPIKVEVFRENILKLLM